MKCVALCRYFPAHSGGHTWQCRCDCVFTAHPEFWLDDGRSCLLHVYSHSNHDQVITGAGRRDGEEREGSRRGGRGREGGEGGGQGEGGREEERKGLRKEGGEGRRRGGSIITRIQIE